MFWYYVDANDPDNMSRLLWFMELYIVFMLSHIFHHRYMYMFCLVEGCRC